MNDQPQPIPWDFLSIVECWNLYGLPVLLTLTTTLIVARRRQASALDAPSLVKQSIRRLGLIHYLLATGFLLALTQDLLALEDIRKYFSVASIFALILQFYIPGIAITANVLVGFGLRRLSRVARILAILWNLLCSALAFLSLWLIYSGAYFAPARWPDLFVAKALPVGLLVILALPRMKLAFTPKIKTNPPPSEPLISPPSQPSTTQDYFLSLIILLLLLIVGSTVVVELSDWIVRAIFPSELDVAMITE